METQTVVITGCTRGLGRALVPLFLKAGWTLAGCARSEKELASLRQQFPGKHLFGKCDVSKEDEVASFCAKILAHFGPPALVLNNAAVINPNAPLWEISAEAFAQTVDVNIKGPAAFMRHLLPAMLKKGGGVIVNLSSGWGRSTSAEVAPYCATKFAIEGLSQATAQDTGGRVAIVALNPGIIDTDMLRSAFGQGAAHYPCPDEWAKRAFPFLVRLGPKDNGRSLTVPD